ncbi:MAG: acyl-CoA dehydrogenase [Casimicrobiaceae bacterium]|nr:acyl-CoA dehydrogenase [Casimicrobiaceae bacterium]MCX8098039.1 acyl-CoA dehydrogenase [Casimicrobiaceae bacterium]MDW8312433.1 acyl-CoA dehydrogenase [Burkholderiales bacterium]
MRAALESLLFDWLAVERLCARARYAEHSRSTFVAVLDTAERIAAERFAPFNRLVDVEEPRAEPGPDGVPSVQLPRATYEAWRAYAESGLLAAAQDEALGGMQLPYVVETAANAFFAKASVSICWALLTTANANAILAHGSPTQRRIFAEAELAGRWMGTMCLSEPDVGSSLSDITTRALLEAEDDPLGPRYRLFGHKMWISGGEHEITENIVHLVLAKIPDAEGRLIPGTRGLSLFIVPKRLVNAAGELTGERNDIVLVGLNHKLGWRGTPNTLLHFGEGRFRPLGAAGAVGYRVGAPGQGLACMFHMMNEARIAIGMAATGLAFAGFEASLAYARERRQGRPLGRHGKDVSSPPVPIIEHADVKRMLLAQKSIAEGALALLLYCARLVDEKRTADPAAAAEAALLLELLTPVAKSWPSENGLEANSLAIQVLGGYGYTRDFPVEQYWRDNRLNMIHEGTHGIQALDLLGRKVVMEGGAALALFSDRVRASVERARARSRWCAHAQALERALEALLEATRAAWATSNPAEALANATPYLQAFGHVTIAWIWLDVALAIEARSDERSVGQRAACEYFYRYELPKVEAWLGVVKSRDMTCAALPPSAF